MMDCEKSGNINENAHYGTCIFLCFGYYARYDSAGCNVVAEVR